MVLPSLPAVVKWASTAHVPRAAATAAAAATTIK